MKKLVSILAIFSMLSCSAISCSFAAETKAQPKTAITQRIKININEVKKAGAAALAATVAVAAAYGIKSAVSKNEVVEQPEHWYTGILNWADNNKVGIIRDTVFGILTFCAWYFGRQGERGEQGERGPAGADAVLNQANVITALGADTQTRLAALGIVIPQIDQASVLNALGANAQARAVALGFAVDSGNANNLHI